MVCYGYGMVWYGYGYGYGMVMVMAGGLGGGDPGGAGGLRRTPGGPQTPIICKNLV